MPIIINDFEVVVDEPSQPAEDTAAPAPQPAPAPMLTPQDLQQIARHQLNRQIRLRAH